MAYSWKILRSAVEQEILFPSEEVYENYLAKYERDKEPYEIVDETKNEDGTYTVVLRKKYNNNPFFRREEEISEEEFGKFIKKLFQVEAEQIEREVEADAKLKNVQPPSGLYEGVMVEIRRREIKELEILLNEIVKRMDKEVLDSLFDCEDDQLPIIRVNDVRKIILEFQDGVQAAVLVDEEMSKV